MKPGSDASGYHVIEGAKTHMDDWFASVQHLLSDRGSNGYSVFRNDLSSVELTDYSYKIAIHYVYFKPGYYG